MSFAAIEASPDRGEPVSLFQFTYGTGLNDVFRYCDGESDFVFAGDTYSAIPIWHEEVTASGTLDKSALIVGFAENTGLTALFRDRPPSAVVSLIIRQGHRNDPAIQFLVNWSGRVIGFNLDSDNNSVELNCEMIATAMKRSALRRRYQYGCSHALYGVQCGADENAATSNFVILGINGSTVTLATDWEAAPIRTQYIGGIARWTLDDGRTEIRTIVNVGIDYVLLNNKVSGISVGEGISLSFGCTHKMDFCRTVHNNIRNFGGQPWIPLKNPVGLKNNYY